MPKVLRHLGAEAKLVFTVRDRVPRRVPESVGIQADIAGLEKLARGRQRRAKAEAIEVAIAELPERVARSRKVEPVELAV